MLYVTYGPFDLETRQGSKATTLDLERSALNKFWENAEKQTQQDLRTALGVYVFAGRVRYNYVPWYVGQAKKGFAQEVFNISNKNKYQTAYCHEMVADKAVVFLIAKVTPRTENLAKSLPAKEANFVEQEIMGRALAANPRLINSSNTGFRKRWEIRGIINTVGSTKELDTATKNLRKCLNMTGDVDVFKTEAN